MAVENSGAKDGELDSNWPEAAYAEYATLTFRAAKTSRLRPLASRDSAVTPCPLLNRGAETGSAVRLSYTERHKL